MINYPYKTLAVASILYIPAILVFIEFTSIIIIDQKNGNSFLSAFFVYFVPFIPLLITLYLFFKINTIKASFLSFILCVPYLFFLMFISDANTIGVRIARSITNYFLRG